MQYTTTYQSPLGEILLAADDIGLTGLWFDGEKFYADSLDPEHEERMVPVFELKKVAGYLFFRQETGFYAARPYDRL